MIITLTMREAKDSGHWEEICEAVGLDRESTEEGLEWDIITEEDTIELTLKQCMEIGLSPKDY